MDLSGWSTRLERVTNFSAPDTEVTIVGTINQEGEKEEGLGPAAEN